MKAPILYSPMMGLGASLDVFAETPAVVIEDFMFESTTAYEITPLASGTVSDFHDAWDLDGTDFTPEASPDDEGYWDDFSNIVTNGTFDADSDWSKGTGWTISDGKAHADVSSTAALSQTLSTGAGNTYEITVTISNLTAGMLQPQFGGTLSSPAQISSNGTHTVLITATSSSSGLLLYAINTSAFSIDNIIIKEYAIQPLDV